MTAIAVHCLPSSWTQAKRLAERLEVPLRPIAVHTFPDGELRVTVGQSSRTAILYASLDHPNDKLIAVLLACDALRTGGARRIVLVAPYLCYMRQDKAFHSGEAVSQRVIGALLSKSVDRVVTVNAHLHRTATIKEVFSQIAADDLSAMPAIAQSMRRWPYRPDTVVAGPDEESRGWVSELARALGLPFMVGKKSRLDDQTVQIVFPEDASVGGRGVVLIDDIVSSGGTLLTCAAALRAAGALSIDAVIVHALFADSLASDLISGGIGSIRSTDSVTHRTNSIHLDALIGTALASEFSLSPPEVRS